MAEEDPTTSLGGEDNASNTPFDLLLNAISGTNDPPNQQDILGDILGTNREPSGKKRKRGLIEVNYQRQKVQKAITRYLVRGLSSTASSDGLMSRVEVWHPSTAQKSYKKERRMLNPPPTLRVTGPLQSLLTSVTLSSTFTPTRPTEAAVKSEMTSQTHHIPLNSPLDLDPPPEDGGAKRQKISREKRIRQSAAKSGFGGSLPWERAKNDSKERQQLSDGLTFPGLWVVEEVGKNKEFNLELKLGQPGAEAGSGTTKVSTPAPKAATPEATAEPAPADEPKEETLQQIDPQLAEPPSEAKASATPQPTESIWGVLPSGPLTIVSKPSQKTVKARNLTTCLTINDPVALYVRINSQTVRTKYLKLETGQPPRLASRTGQWTPFKFEIISRATPPARDGRAKFSQSEFTPDILTYGSIVCLIDVQTGVKSEPVRVVKVEKNEVMVGEREGDPISELQRVAFARVQDGLDDLRSGGRWYLSAPGARAGGGELLPEQPAKRRPKRVSKVPQQAQEAPAPAPAPEQVDQALVEQTLQGLTNDETQIDKPDGEQADPTETDLPQDVKDALLGMVNDDGEVDAVQAYTELNADSKLKRQKTRRNALALATLAEQEGTGEQNALQWVRAPREMKEVEIEVGKEKRKEMKMVEDVEDWMCWVITGVSSFSYSFFDGMSGADQTPLPNRQTRLDPVPRLLTEPAFHHESNTIDLILADFFLLDSPLDIYLGPIGPLRISTWRSTAPMEKIQSRPKTPYAAVPLDSDRQMGITQDKQGTVFSDFPGTTPHVLVVVEMPSPESIIQVMKECVAARDQLEKAEQQAANIGIQGLENWLDPEEDTMTIQEALKNAEQALGQVQTSANTADAEGKQVESSSMEDTANMIPDVGTMVNLEPDIDPTLQIMEQAVSVPEDRDKGKQQADQPQAAAPEAELAQPVTGNGEGQASDSALQDMAEAVPPPPTLITEQKHEKKVEFVPLPFLMLRSDGVAFGVGKSVVAERLGGEEVDPPQWGLRVVPS